MIKNRRLYRERWDKKIGGVCGGLAQYFRIDSSLIRLICLLALFFSAGIIIIPYGVLWALLPLGPRAYVHSTYKRLYRSRKDRKIAGVFGGFGAYFRIDSNILRFIAVILLFVTGFLPLCIAYFAAVLIIPEHP